MSDISNQKRERRTNEQLDIDVWNTLERLVAERGFNIPLTLFAKEAGLIPSVFYRRYGTMEVLYEKMVDQHLSVINDTMAAFDTSNISEQEACDLYTKMFKMLSTELAKDKIMQQLLLWELSEGNITTRKISRIREKIHRNLVAHSDVIFKASGINLKSITALLLAGVYYTTLYNKPLCTVNFADSVGQIQLSKIIDEIMGLIFEKQKKRQYWQGVIERMQKHGIPQVEIAKYLGVSEIKLKRLRNE